MQNLDHRIRCTLNNFNNQYFLFLLQMLILILKRYTNINIIVVNDRTVCFKAMLKL